MATTTGTPMRPLPAPLSWLVAPLILVERTRGRWRLALLLAYLMIASTLAAVTWWATSLWKLPDVGDPFDVAAFGTVAVPDDRNAYVLYRKAAERVKPMVDFEARMVAGRKPNLAPEWSAARPEEKDELARNADALELWRQGTERPDAVYVQPKDFSSETILAVPHQMRVFSRLALLEAARRTDEGDMAGAWRYHRANLRASRHLGMHGSMIERLVGKAIVQKTGGAAEKWAADPKVDAALLRQALDDMKTIEAMTADNSVMLKAEYLATMKLVEEPEKAINWSYSDGSDWQHHLPGYTKTTILWRRETERARRVLRLAFANFLARCDLPASARGPQTQELDLYPAPADAPLSPRDLEAWGRSSLVVMALRPNIRGVMVAADQDRLAVASLRVMLAQHLYLRERGKPIVTLGELVGPYLDKLPPDFTPQDAPLTLTSPTPAPTGAKP